VRPEPESGGDLVLVSPRGYRVERLTEQVAAILREFE
jgi:hypothetical protein